MNKVAALTISNLKRVVGAAGAVLATAAILAGTATAGKPTVSCTEDPGVSWTLTVSWKGKDPVSISYGLGATYAVTAADKDVNQATITVAHEQFNEGSVVYFSYANGRTTWSPAVFCT